MEIYGARAERRHLFSPEHLVYRLPMPWIDGSRRPPLAASDRRRLDEIELGEHVADELRAQNHGSAAGREYAAAHPTPAALFLAREVRMLQRLQVLR